MRFLYFHFSNLGNSNGQVCYFYRLYEKLAYDMCLNTQTEILTVLTSWPHAMTLSWHEVIKGLEEPNRVLLVFIDPARRFSGIPPALNVLYTLSIPLQSASHLFRTGYLPDNAVSEK